ncbi:alpha-ketoglutarate-dependent dioxygenase AlkB [Gallaecimonas sp. GXIMD4217]|uniref:alpha-ketoglutarate-dependent dioxygenase AlkB family protein n=1 Tax=Gallaecimonas sp. GXIMD4217 TaxID=3131927 RepID=UPI00311B2AA8
MQLNSLPNWQGPHFDTSQAPVHPALSERELWLWPSVMTASDGHELMALLQRELSWSQPKIRLFGKVVAIPRLQSWVGDPQATYTYSGRRLSPLPWHPCLLALARGLGQRLQLRFNSVLVNWYRDGQDAMGWHSDDEPELGPTPAIAMLSLGAERDLRFRHKGGDDRFTLALPHTSLLLMAGRLQQHWQHEVPRRRRVKEARLSLTFRWVNPLQA